MASLFQSVSFCFSSFFLFETITTSQTENEGFDGVCVHGKCGGGQQQQKTRTIVDRTNVGNAKVSNVFFSFFQNGED